MRLPLVSAPSDTETLNAVAGRPSTWIRLSPLGVLGFAREGDIVLDINACVDKYHPAAQMIADAAKRQK